jgi:hypothetical protein
MNHHENVILQLKSRKGRYWMQDIGGQLYTKISMITINPMMHTKEHAN